MSGIAIITGGSRGIGAATSRLAAAAGFDVCLSYVSDSKSAAEVTHSCVALGRKAIAVQADVANPDDVARLFETCDGQLGPVTLLVNNAGIIGASSKLVDLTDEVLSRTFEVNVYGTIYCAREAIKRMAKSTGGQGGVIINVSSVAARLGSPGEYVHYAASKAAVETLTIGLSKEVGRDGIRVNALQAGTTDTEIHVTSGNPDRPSIVAAAAPLGRVASTQDIAEGIMWLASSKAEYTTGVVLPISGGM